MKNFSNELRPHQNLSNKTFYLQTEQKNTSGVKKLEVKNTSIVKKK